MNTNLTASTVSRALVLTLVMAAAEVRAQSQPVCYFGECEATPPNRAPEPAPRRQPDAPTPRPQPDVPPPEPRRPPPVEPNVLPPFFARNMCFMGNVAVPVNDGDTCARLYNVPSSRRNDGQPAECGILHRNNDGTVSITVMMVSAVGECWGARNDNTGRYVIRGRCNSPFPGAITHWRLDMDQYQCVSGNDSRFIFRP